MEYNISQDTWLKIQEARQPLIIDDLSGIHSHFHRILQLDPSPFYERLGDTLNPFKRNNNVSIIDLFPSPEDGTCSCGCGVKLEGRRTRWASDKCVDFPVQIYNILAGRSEYIKLIMVQIYENRCFDCGKDWKGIQRPNPNDWRTPIELEHILPVKNGGGGCWLSNYKFRCFECHQHKTRSDFGWNKKPKKEQFKLF